MIQISDLEFRYPRGGFALHVPDLDVEAGEQVAIIGPSGCGKTTLLHLVAGIRRPLRGTLRVRGEVLSTLDDGARRSFRIVNIGLVFQEFELLEHLDVRDNILVPYRINPSLKLTREVRSRVDELAVETGIGDKLDRLPGRLSQGERQRVAVCRALVSRPDLVLADEPTGNLDPANKGRVLDLLLSYVESCGATLVVVTHDHDLLDRFERVVDFKDFYVPGGAAADA